MTRFCVALAAIAALCGVGVAHAQVIDSVDVQRHGKDAEIAIRFTSPVQYLRHAPLDFGASLRIYARVVRPADQDTDVRRETARLPETDLVPRFTLTYPEADGAISIAFDSPTRFSVRGGNDGKSIVLLVPALQNAQDFTVQVKSAASTGKPGATQIAETAGAPPVQTAQSVPNTPLPAPISAPAVRRIDSIGVQRLGKNAEIRIRFTSPIRIARPTPPGTGDTVNIYPSLLQAGKAPETQGRETNRLEETDLVPPFTLSYPESDASLVLRFDQATRYSVEKGPDDRSISVVVPMMPGAKDVSFHVQGSQPWPAFPSTVAAAVVAPAPAIAAAAAASASPQPATRASSVVAPGAVQPTPASPSAAVAAAPAAVVAAAPAPAIPAAAPSPQRTPPASTAGPTPAAIVTPTASPAPSASAPAVAPSGPAPSSAIAASQAAVLPTPQTPERIEARAKLAMEEAQRALAGRIGAVAAERLGQVLALPPNSQSRLAQALIGEAHEYSGEPHKARTEYELYLRRYPEGAEAARVKERLAALDKSTALAGSAGKASPPRATTAPSGSAIARTPAAAAATAGAPATQVQPPAGGVEAQAKAAMEDAQRALAGRIGVIAAERLSQILALPSNAQSRLAQALIGEAHEYSGEPHKARTEYELYLTRYPNGEEANRVRERLAALDRRAADLAAGRVPSSQDAVAPAASAPVPTPAAGAAAGLATPVPLTADGIEARAKAAMVEAQAALARRNGVIAADRLGQVLGLPPNSQSSLAQALIGEAREYSGELRKAKAEYELYLKRYPSGAEAARVKERLAALDKNIAQVIATAPGGSAAPGGSGLAKPAEWTVYGSISQYGYRGNSQIETLTPPPPGQLTFNTDKLSLQDQNAIMTTLDLNARKREGGRDTRIVIRDSDTHNYLQGQKQVQRLYSAYFEQTDKQVGYLVRAGRQTGNGGGVFGRFDGVWAGYNLNPSWRINGVVGTPVEFNFPLKRSVQGLSIDRIPELNKIGYSLYYVEQPLEGINDRKAVGGEVRYFDPKRTAYGMVDYDINFQSLNIAMAQANWRTDAGTNYFANADVRKSPMLGLLSAMPAQQVLDPFTLLPVFTDLRTQLLTAVNTHGIGDLRSQAEMLTGTSRFYTAGFMRPVTPKWQLGANYSLAFVSGTGGVGIMPAQPSSGGSNVYSGTALGSNLMLSNDTLVLNGSLIDNPTSFGQSYNVSYVVPYKDWRFDVIMRYYGQTDNQDQKQVRLAPTFKISYRWRNSVSLEFEVGNENVDETGPLREMHSRRRYFFGGYRWDFR